SIDKIRLDIGNCLEKRTLLRENRSLRQQVAAESSTHDLVFASRAMENVLSLAAKSSGLDMPVLILGESGTGKEVVARFIHARSPRAQAPFFAVNCGALSESLLEPALFGYEKGAFTGAAATTAGYFEAARGGAIFLDEIGETTPSFQVKLLRVLQEGEIMRVGGTRPIKVDFRLISATNTDLAALIREGGFRKDLYYRINVVRIEIPPLRERRDDIPVLLEHFMGQVCSRNNLKHRSFSRDALDCLMDQPWEGNVRELRNLVERLMVSSGRGAVARRDLPEEYRDTCRKTPDDDRMPLSYEQARARFEEDYLRRLLEAASGDLKKASAISGLDLSTLYRRKNKIIA
ncbi:MAG TPA: sigma-54 dependent transcriptional regulator, partial [Deltaproteobacteria bacterium]|nr:sigma-54 dependent transcriptional regulator [Deltaproteobacteria bacterium]